MFVHCCVKKEHCCQGLGRTVEWTIVVGLVTSTQDTTIHFCFYYMFRFNMFVHEINLFTKFKFNVLTSCSNRHPYCVTKLKKTRTFYSVFIKDFNLFVK